MDNCNGQFQKYACIDGLKGIGAFIIAFVWHYQNISVHPVDWMFGPILKYGWLMVELFFMVSGFGMAFGYEKK